MHRFDINDVLVKYLDSFKTATLCSRHNVTRQTISGWRRLSIAPPTAVLQMAIDWYCKEAEQDTQAMWSGRKVLIAMPIYESLNPKTFFSLVKAWSAYGPDKVGIIYQERTRIEEARNILVDRFMRSDAEWLIMVDDDMVMPCGAADWYSALSNNTVPNRLAGLNFITRLMSFGEDKPIIGALYFGRNGECRPQCDLGWSKQANSTRSMIGTGLVRQPWVGTGLMRIHRSVFDTIKDHASMWPEIQPVDNHWHGYFTTHRVGMSEDVSFCLRAKQIDIPCYLDTDLIALHSGQCLYGPGTMPEKYVTK